MKLGSSQVRRLTPLKFKSNQCLLVGGGGHIEMRGFLILFFCQVSKVARFLKFSMLILEAVGTRCNEAFNCLQFFCGAVQVLTVTYYVNYERTPTISKCSLDT